MVQEGKSYATIKQFVAVSNWILDLGGFDKPCESPVVLHILAGAQHKVRNALVHKSPVTVSMLDELHDTMFAGDDFTNIKDVRDLHLFLSVSVDSSCVGKQQT